jgi:cyclic pyranopterin monophosphate synthase
VTRRPKTRPGSESGGPRGRDRDPPPDPPPPAERAGPQAASTFGLSHFDASGAARMVDVGAKPETERIAIASGMVVMEIATASAVRAGTIGKGDVLGVARIAGIQAAKRTSDIIPLCHPLRLTGVDVDLRVANNAVYIMATVRAFDRSGVEMEALAAVSAAALTIYDMCKAIDRGMVISEIRLDEKRGGKSGTWTRALPGNLVTGKSRAP